ncbi:MAG: signal peptidase II [Rhodobacteraceae bacterium]|nr:signal peptidase II [Paracoccaceae bacterium]
MRALGWAAIFAFLIDQASKYLVVVWMDLAHRRAIDVMPPYLNLRYGENRGINFGILDGAPDMMRWILVALSLVIILAVLVWMVRGHKPLAMRLGAGLLIGGALGNVLDRVLYGYVLDFLNMSCCGINNPFVFNLADAFIFLGAAALVIFDARPTGKKAP